MDIMECLGIDKNNNLTIGGVSVKDICDEYKTPLYILDEDEIRKNCRIYKEALLKHYDGNGLVLYASKALSCIKMCKIIDSEGLGLDVVSGGELYTALKAKFPTDKIYFHGNNKTDEELKMAVENNVGTIVVDNLYELTRLNDIAKSYGKIANISYRIKPGIDAHTHDFISTGQIDSKFGVALDNGEAEQFALEAVALENISLKGVHCHIGSQIFDIEPFLATAEKMMDFIIMLKNKHNISINELNLGGGYGIKYTEDDDPVPYGSYIEKVSALVKKIASENNIGVPKILMEPGRSIVAPAGITVYTVGVVKEIENVRTYVSVDGGMADNPRYIMYDAKYDAVLVNNPSGERTDLVTIAGKSCESGDILIKDIKLPKIKSGDLLAVLSTGAYNYSMSSNYNRIPRPPVVMVSGGKTYIAVKRETYEDIIRNDIWGWLIVIQRQ